MSRAICIMGESGSGKTTSMRGLPPDKTYYIDCDEKGLSWRGWRNNFSEERKNYITTRDIPKIAALLKNVSEKAPEVRFIVIDTLNTSMVDHEVNTMKETGHGKWIDLTQFIWSICSIISRLRSDITVIVVMHSETIREDNGYFFTRIRTNGRKLEKIVLESLFSTVLLAKRNDNGEYIFETQAKNSTAKSPMGAFADFEVENDIVKVIKALEDY